VRPGSAIVTASGLGIAEQTTPTNRGQALGMHFALMRRCQGVSVRFYAQNIHYSFFLRFTENRALLHRLRSYVPPRAVVFRRTATFVWVFDTFPAA
jgi:hypothetical protein